MRIILASKSPRRKELMDLAEFNYEIIPSHSPENWDDDLTIEENSINLGYDKARDVYENTQGDRAIIGSDTIVVKDNEVFGKPESREDAIRMLKDLQGTYHFVYTSLTILIEDKGKEKVYKETHGTKVFIKPMSDAEITHYVDTYDVMDKAGAYAIQSKFAVYIERIEGDYNSIIGLPISRIYDIFKENEIW